MAQLNLYTPLDLTPGTGGTGEPGEAGRVLYHDTESVLVRSGPYLTLYSGHFTYSGTADWHGTITEYRVLHRGELMLEILDMAVGTRYFTVPTTFESAQRAAFAGDDVMVGSGGDDAFIGYSGADSMKGGRGDDLLYGRDDADHLQAGAGRDRLDGGPGSDTLDGGSGDDRLVGQDGADLFAFSGDAGRDVIADFQNRVDHIAIEGLRRFDALAVTQDGDDVRIAYGETQIVLQDTLLRTIGADDFVFGL